MNEKKLALCMENKQFSKINNVLDRKSCSRSDLEI